MLKEARKAVGMSLDEASYNLNLSRGTLIKYEAEPSLTPPETVLSMAKIYQKRDLLDFFCHTTCPLGSINEHCLENCTDLLKASVAVLQRMGPVQKNMQHFLDIIADGKIEDDEMEVAQKVFSDFHELEKSLESLRVFVQSMQIYEPTGMEKVG